MSMEIFTILSVSLPSGMACFMDRWLTCPCARQLRLKWFLHVDDSQAHDLLHMAKNFTILKGSSFKPFTFFWNLKKAKPFNVMFHCI